MRRASHSSIRDFGCIFEIYNAELVRAFDFGPHHIFSKVEVISKVDRIKEVPVTHHPRKYGKSGWTFAKLWGYNMHNVVLMLQRPFQYIAGFCAVAGVLFAIRILLSVFSDFAFLGEVTNGLLLNAIALTSLMIMGILALIGEFGVRSFSRLQSLPAYVVRERLAKGEDAND